MELHITVAVQLPHAQIGGFPNRPGKAARGSHAEAFRVILHQDTLHEIPSVAAMLTEIITALDEGAALRVAEQAFTAGQAVVIACRKSTAERYREQLTSQYQLLVTLEAV